MIKKDNFEINSADFLFLQDEYYKEALQDSRNQSKKNVFDLFFKSKYGQKNTFQYNSEIIKKFNRIPLVFLKYFDQIEYRLLNPDINDAINKGVFRNPLEHFIIFGFDEVKNGKRQISYNFPKISEQDYINKNSDARVALDKGLISCGFEHFLYLGHAANLEGNQKLKYENKIGKNKLGKNILKKFKSKFDEDAYLKANPDVKEAIETGKVKSAWKHFIKNGYYEIRDGQRSIHHLLEPISESAYINKYSDIKSALENKVITSAFEHYLLFGHQEILEGSRRSDLSVDYVFYQLEQTKSIEKEIIAFAHSPLVSIVMPVFDVDAIWLEKAINSIQNQWYQNWELCISDDCSTKKETLDYLSTIQNEKIKIKYLDSNLNICGASNEALKLASGEYIALMDNDDELTPNALYEVVKTINEFGAEFIYSDEDKLEFDGSFSEPNFKPDYSHDTFLSTNYLSHLTVIKKTLIDKVGGWESGLEGSQDYDLYLKVLEHTNQIRHISKVLYHWRKIEGSTAESYGEKSYANEAGRKALENAMKRRNIPAKVIGGLNAGTYRIRYEIQDQPLVTIVIPFKDKPELLQQCISSILDKSTYSNIEIIGVSNNSIEENTFKLMDELSKFDNRIHFVEYNVEFNYSQINNYAVKEYANGDFIIFLNNDIKIISSEWIESMLELAQMKKVGAVGAKLYYPDDTVQHAGLVTKVANTVVAAFSFYPRNSIGYGCRLQIINNFSAVTAACMMIKKELFLNFNGFDEKNLKVAYNDVDLCLSLVEKGFRNILTPYAEAYHYESISRGADIGNEKVWRRCNEHYFLVNKHPSFFVDGDPCYNSNLSEISSNFSINRLHTSERENVIPQMFSEKITQWKQGARLGHKRICIFSHFDKNGNISEYVMYFLKNLSVLTDIVFISTAQLSFKEIEPLLTYCRDVIVKENTGYDFGAWKTGIDHLGEEIDQYQQLVICNDSVYGPLFNLSHVFKAMDKAEADIYSITDNLEIIHHLQSYFIIFNKNIINSEQFKHFWTNLCIIKDKQKLIESHEIGLSQMLKASGFKLGSYVESSEITKGNITHLKWRELINQYQSPFIKIELLRDNPLSLDVKDYKTVIQENTEYPFRLIENHLQSVK